MPTPQYEIDFLVNVQRLLGEGQFTASYKFALLLALADLSVENLGDESDAPMEIGTRAIAEKFIQYYWRQAVPYPAPARAKVLKQNKGKQAAIVKAVGDARAEYGDTLPKLMKSGAGWRSLVTEVARVVQGMPLQYLQNVGGERLYFLYGDVGRVVELRPGVAHCFRKFHALIGDLVRGAWLRYVGQQNLDVLGETTDLNEFLFGTDRNNLVEVRKVLTNIEGTHCFYCGRDIAEAAAHVDHFIAWSRYPTDLGHNFVLADSNCNRRKGDRLPAYEHLARWTKRNETYGTDIARELERRGVIAELAASNCVARWAYEQAAAADGLTWVRAEEMEPLDRAWRSLFE